MDWTGPEAESNSKHDQSMVLPTLSWEIILTAAPLWVRLQNSGFLWIECLSNAFNLVSSESSISRRQGA